jgi:hypothetical protein
VPRLRRVKGGDRPLRNEDLDLLRERTMARRSMLARERGVTREQAHARIDRLRKRVGEALESAVGEQAGWLRVPDPPLPDPALAALLVVSQSETYWTRLREAADRLYVDPSPESVAEDRELGDLLGEIEAERRRREADVAVARAEAAVAALGGDAA